MIPRQIVLDTNVIIAGLMSQLGASYQLLQMIGTGRFELQITVALLLEYEMVAKRMSSEIGLVHRDIEDVLDFIVAHSETPRIHYLWRPYLSDPNDDMLLELAVASHSKYIVTHNVSDFHDIERFQVSAITPRSFLRILRHEHN